MFWRITNCSVHHESASSPPTCQMEWEVPHTLRALVKESHSHHTVKISKLLNLSVFLTSPLISIAHLLCVFLFFFLSAV